MEILKNYLKKIKESEKFLKKENNAHDAEIIKKIKKDQTELTEELVKEVSNLHNSIKDKFDPNNTCYNKIEDSDKKFSEKDLKGKKVYFFHTGNFPMKQIKEICTVLSSPIDADIIVYSHYDFYLTKLEEAQERQTRTHLWNTTGRLVGYTTKIDGLDYITHYVNTEYLRPSNIIQINKFYEAFVYLQSENNCQIINYHNIKLSDNVMLNCAKPELTLEVQKSLTMMLKSSDVEIFNIGWKSLWEYDYVKNDLQILPIYCAANLESFYKRSLNKSTEFCFKKWKSKWPMLCKK